MTQVALDLWKDPAAQLEAANVVRVLPAAVEKIIQAGTLLAAEAEADLGAMGQWVKLDAAGTVEEVRSLGLALGFAEGQWSTLRNPRRDAEYKELVAQLSARVGNLLRLADVVAHGDEVLEARLHEIRSGSGIADMCQDGRDIVALFRSMWGRVESLFTSELVNVEMLDDTEGMANALSDEHAIFSAPDAEAALDLRNRILTLYLNRIEELRAAGTYALRFDRKRQQIYRTSLRRRFSGRSTATAEADVEADVEASPAE